MEVPFTATDNYNYFDAFFMGLQLDDWYEYSDDCVNNFVFATDDGYYLMNNITRVDEIIAEESMEENYFHVWLNATKMISTNIADAVPNCY